MIALRGRVTFNYVALAIGNTRTYRLFSLKQNFLYQR